MGSAHSTKSASGSGVTSSSRPSTRAFTGSLFKLSRFPDTAVTAKVYITPLRRPVTSATERVASCVSQEYAYSSASSPA